MIWEPDSINLIKQSFDSYVINEYAEEPGRGGRGV